MIRDEERERLEEVVRLTREQWYDNMNAVLDQQAALRRHEKYLELAGSAYDKARAELRAYNVRNLK
jgi:hypothetical protein